MNQYETRVTEITTVPTGEKLYSEMATRVSIDDEGPGEFVVLRQTIDEADGKIRINPEEWPVLRGAIDAMVSVCRGCRDGTITDPREGSR